MIGETGQGVDNSADTPVAEVAKTDVVMEERDNKNVVDGEPLPGSPDLDEEDEKVVEDEEQWTSRGSFILAAVGSAIGLGNFWRFPFLVFEYGGGSFFIPYFIALVFVGIPLMQLEMGVGQAFRRSATQSFGMLHPRLRGIGVGAGFIAFSIVTYYMAILGWGNVYLVQSFYSDLPWSIYGVEGKEASAIPTNHFLGDTLQRKKDVTTTSIIVSSIFAGSFVMWIIVTFILYKGSEFISKAVWVTVLLPVFTLLILLIVGATLDGAGDGINEYIGKWEFDKLSEGDMWVDAFGQVFFSLSLSTGVMTAYASMNPRNADIVKDAMIVSLLNCSFSFLAGFAVFAVAGYLSLTSAQTFKELEEILGGPMLAFVAYPAGLSLVPGAGANVLCVLFFVTFFFLGLDSAFSLVESTVMNFRETKYFGSYTKVELTLAVCVVGMVSTILFCSDIGLTLLDVVDDYVAGLGLLFIGLVESIAAGWMYNRHEVTEKVGSSTVIAFEAGMGLGFTLFTILSVTIPIVNEDAGAGIKLGVPFGVGLVVMIPGVLLSISMAKAKAGSEGPKILMFHGIDSLRERLNKIITKGKPSNWRFNWFWGFLIKFIIPAVLEYLLILRIASRIDAPYNDYIPGVQAVGAIFFLCVVLLVAIGAIKPRLFEMPEKRAGIRRVDIA